MLCVIWYYLRNLKNVKTSMEDCLFLVRLFLVLFGMVFLNSENGTKLHKGTHMKFNFSSCKHAVTFPITYACVSSIQIL